MKKSEPTDANGGHDKMDARQIILDRPMSGLQKRAIAVCFALQAIDGYDVLAITFAAPGFAKQWGIAPAITGAIISAGPVGMLFGSLLLAPFADVIGRRWLILLSVAMMTVGMALSAVATGVWMLGASRVVTGLGVGAVIGSLTALSAEYANQRNRDLAISIMAIGYPVGGFAAGAAAAVLLRDHGWMSIFALGALVTAAMLPLVYRLPESIEFLCARRGEAARGDVNAILRRMGHPETFTIIGPKAVERPSRLLIFGPALVRNTLLLTLAYALHNITFYYVVGWTPANVAALGFNPATAASVATWVSIGGIAGAIGLGWLSHRYRLKPLVLGTLGLTSLCLLTFAQVSTELTSLKILVFATGAFMFASVVGVFAITARLYQPELRATGAGFVIGAGRMGAVLGPLLAGMLLSHDMGRDTVTLILAMGSAAALLCIAKLNIAETEYR